MAPSNILAAAVGAALALAACTPQRDTAERSRPTSSARPQGSQVYGSSGAGAAGIAAGAPRRNDNDADSDARAARGSTTGEGESAESASHGGFGDSGTAGEGG